MEDVIKEVIKQFKSASEEDKNKAMDLFLVLRSSNVWVPCNAILGENDKKQWEDLIEKYKDNLEGMTDEVVTSKDPTRLVPDILTNGTDYFFPVFSTPEEMGEYGKNFSKVESGFLKAVSLASNNPKNVVGLVINPFSDSFLLNREAFDLFLNVAPIPKPNSQLRLFIGSFLDQEVDAVVNSANCNLKMSPSTDRVFKKAGYAELRDACSKIETPIQNGQAVITPAFNIKNAKAIIHAVAPEYPETPNDFDEIFSAYFCSLLVLKTNNFHSIAFPLISAGIYSNMLKINVEKSTEQCCRAFDAFLYEYPDYEIDVRLCVSTEEEAELSSKAIDRISQKIECTQEENERNKK